MNTFWNTFDAPLAKNPPKGKPIRELTDWEQRSRKACIDFVLHWAYWLGGGYVSYLFYIWVIRRW